MPSMALGMGIGVLFNGGPVGSVVVAPAAFGYTPPFLVSKSGSVYTTNFNMDAVKPTPTNTIYCGAGGNNANDGSTWALRVRSLKQMLVKGAALGGSATVRYLVQSGQYLFSNVDGSSIPDSFAGQYYDGHLLIEPCDSSGNPVATSTSTRIISVQNQVMPAFVSVGSNVYSSTYTTELPSFVAWDAAVINASGNPQAVLNAPPATTYANAAAIIAGVNAQAALYGQGACWIDTTNKIFYLQTYNNRAPDANITVGRGTGNANDANARNLYLGGRFGGIENVWIRNLHTWGGCGLYAAINQGGGENRNITLYWADGGTHYSCANGINGDGAYTLTFQNHRSEAPYKDGFNYDQATSLDPSATAVGRFNEINCTTDWSGNDAQGDSSCNGSSAHRRVMGSRVGGTYNRTTNRGIHDINASQSWNLGVTVSNCRQTGTQAGAFVSGFLPNTGETSKVWLDGCTSTNNAYALEAYKGGILYYANMTTISPTDTATGGTITTYNSPPAVPGATGTLSSAAIDSANVQLTFTAASGAASYEYRINGGSAVALAGTKIVSGLTQLTLYNFEVRGVNSDGNGPWSNVSSTTTPASATPTNILLNGDFAGGTTSWTGFGFNGKSVTAGKGTFVATTAFDGINQAGLPFTAGKYYDLVFTLVVTSGTAYGYFSGGTGVNGTTRSASGTYTERIQAGSGNNNFGFQGNTTITMTIDDISVTGPYDTP